MADETAFDAAEFLGLARKSKRDPYRLGLFARHFEAGERARALLPIAGGTLVVTDRRLLHFTTHLEVDGAWNVREFAGYTVSREVPLPTISQVRRSTRSAGGELEDILLVQTLEGSVEFAMSKGPKPVVSEGDGEHLIALLTPRSPSPG